MFTSVQTEKDKILALTNQWGVEAHCYTSFYNINLRINVVLSVDLIYFNNFQKNGRWVDSDKGMGTSTYVHCKGCPGIGRNSQIKWRWNGTELDRKSKHSYWKVVLSVVYNPIGLHNNWRMRENMLWGSLRVIFKNKKQEKLNFKSNVW